MTHIEKINIVRIFIYALIIACFFLIKALVQNDIDEPNKEESKKRAVLIKVIIFLIIVLFGVILYIEH